MIGIYKITSPNKRVYIGQSIDILKRFSYYKRLSCESQLRLYNSFIKYGVENHIFEIIEECNFEQLNIRERYWQDYYDVLDKNKGLNCLLTKTNELKLIRSNELKLKMASNGFKGKKHSNETKLKMSISNHRKPLKGINHYKARIVLNNENGIFYDCIREAAESLNLSKYTLADYLSGKRKNKTNLILI